MTREYYLERGGESLHLDGNPIGVLDGGSGFGLPPVEARWFEGAGDGSLLRGVRVGRREITDLPVIVTGDDADDLLANADMLTRFLTPRQGTTRLRVDMGSDSWYVDVIRTGGGDPESGVDSNGSSWAVYRLQLASGDPFWTRERASVQVIRAAGLGRGLLRPGGSLTQLRLSSGQAIGEVTLENPGTAEAWPTVTVAGPGRDLVARSDTGETVLWNGEVLAGEVRVLDFRAGTIVDGDGVNRYDELGPAPRFWEIPPGSTVATFAMDGAAAGSYEAVGFASVNRFLNPSMRSVVDGLTALVRWNRAAHPFGGGTLAPYSSTAVTVTPDVAVDDHPDGLASALRVEYDGSGGNAGVVLTTGGLVTGVHTVSAWVKTESVSGSATLAFAEQNVTSGPNLTVPPGEWTRVSWTHDFTTGRAGFRVGQPGGQGGSYLITGMLMERGSTVRPVFGPGVNPDPALTLAVASSTDNGSSLTAPSVGGVRVTGSSFYGPLYQYQDGDRKTVRLDVVEGAAWRLGVACDRQDYYAPATIVARVRASWTGTLRLTAGGPTTDQGEVPVPVTAGQWLEVRAYIPEGGEADTGFVGRAGDGWTLGDSLEVDRALLVDGEYAGSYFDGSFSDGPQGVFEWYGDPDESPSGMYESVLVGQTSITVAWQPRRWLVN